MPRLIMLSGNSGVGKTYVINNFNLLSDNVCVVKKKTTRPARSYEPENETIELIFDTPKEDILKMDFNYKYREHFYGFNHSDIDEVFAKGLSPILVVRRIDCIQKLRQNYENTFSILVKAENKNTIYEKLNQMGYSDSELSQRLNMEYELGLEKEYNDNMHLFDCTVYNLYNNKFIFEINNVLHLN